MKSSGISYILWCAWLFGFGGIHRLYLGKYVSGAIYFFTFGLFGVGQIIDLFLIPGMVERENIKLQLKEGRTVNIHLPGRNGGDISLEKEIAARHKSSQKRQMKSAPKQTQETQILQLARKFGGQLTPVELATHTSLSLEESDKALEDLVRKGYANMNVTDSGHIIYDFPGFLDVNSSDF